MNDEKYEEALEFVYEKGEASISMIQRRFRIGYNRAARIVERMEREGVVGPVHGDQAEGSAEKEGIGRGLHDQGRRIEIMNVTGKCVKVFLGVCALLWLAPAFGHADTLDSSRRRTVRSIPWRPAFNSGYPCQP